MKNRTLIVIFGITGDLAKKKLIPALFNLWKNNNLKNINIVGFSRRHMTDEEIRNELSVSLPKNILEKEKQDFLSLVFYKQGMFDSIHSYNDLLLYLNNIDKKFGECSSKLFYLSVPPTLYEMILKNIHTSGLHIHCGTNERQTKILIEKPFGNDVKTAKNLDALLGKLFKESQLYRIDHYLGKETLQNILTFRFSNTMFEPLWNNKHIKKVEINLYEKNVVGTRGAFYDDVGALKDVGQNHMLAMLALVAMEQPKSFNVKDVRSGREKVISKIMLSKGKYKDKNISLVRAQYDMYESEVGKKSDTETFFRVVAEVGNRKWRGVPFVLSSGKGLQESKTEIKIYFKDPSPLSFLPPQQKDQETNVLNFRIQPNEGIEILFWVKTPGFEQKIESKKLSFNYSDSENKIPDAYERIFFDCILGDQTLFPTTKEILGQWKFVEQAIKVIKKAPLIKYKVGGGI